MIVKLFRNLPSDKSISMELYADNLQQGLEKSWKVESVICPEIKLPVNKKILKYINKFYKYPKFAKSQQGDINHIMDHSYSNLASGLNPEKTIITCHDLMLFREREKTVPNDFHSNAAFWALRHSLSAFNKVAAIIADSSSTRDDIIKYTSCDPSKIHVVHLGVSGNFSKIEGKSIINDKYGLNKMPSLKILHVGVNMAYKNVEGILRILKMLNFDFKIDASLIKIGEDFTSHQKRIIKKYDLESKVLYLGQVKSDELTDIYNLCDILLFPSFWEGFGLPVLEAFACGVPVVCSDRGSLPEIAGDAALMFDPMDYLGFAKAIKEVHDNKELKNNLVMKGLKQSKLFSWDKTAQKTYEVYKKVLDKRRFEI